MTSASTFEDGDKGGGGASSLAFLLSLGELAALRRRPMGATDIQKRRPQSGKMP